MLLNNAYGQKGCADKLEFTATIKAGQGSMGKKNKQEKQLKAVKKRLEQEQKSPKGRKPYATALAVTGSASLIMAGGDILVNNGAGMLTSLCLLMGIISLFFAYKVYSDEAERMRRIEKLERERNDLRNRMDE